MGKYIEDKDKMRIKSLEQLQEIANVVNDAALALQDKNRTILDSPLSEVLSAALGAGVGGVGSFAALYGLGSVVGLSASGISSGLAAAGSVVGGGMAAGLFVLAAPIAGLAALGAAAAAHRRMERLHEEKERLYQLVIQRHEAMIKELRFKWFKSEERIKYLTSLNILLEKALKDLGYDLGVA